MKILSLHCDYLKFKPLKKALKAIEDLTTKEKTEKHIKEPLVILTSVEKGDTNADELVKNILEIAKQVKANSIVLYPYAHLSSNLASPDDAVKVLKQAESKLKKLKFDITRAPFGYYKEFELKVKGHPLAELSRSTKRDENIKSMSINDNKNVKEEKYDPKQLLHEISKNKLNREKLKDNDHRILGQQMDLFSFSEVAPGMVFWHDKGLTIFNELVAYWRQEHRKENFKEISTPLILDQKLWKISGHYEKFKENMFMTTYEGREFAIKPMNCPGGMLVYKNSPKSYKDLPLRVGELGVVHRQELSGVLAGLFRVIRITQDDAHIFCADEKQLESEIIAIIDMIDGFYKKFNLSFDHVELSTRPAKRIGDDKVWDMAEGILEKVLKRKKMKFSINKGDGAFYGPKIDFHVKDSLNRTWQLSTIQLDFAMPERFELEYVDKDNKKKRPIMLHRVIYGSLERFIGILLEHTNGKLPTWLSPVQVKVLSFTERNIKAAQKFADELKTEGIRTEIDVEEAPTQGRVRNAEIQKIPYIIMIGDKEEQASTLAVRKNSKVQFGVKKEEFIKQLKQEIQERL